MPIFEKLFNEVKDSIPRLAEDSLSKSASEAAKIMTDHLEKAKADLRTCTLLLAAGKIGKEEFKSTVRGKLKAGISPLIEMQSLTESEAEELMETVVNNFIRGAVGAFLFPTQGVGTTS